MLKDINTVSTNTIEAIISRKEMIELIESDSLDKENLILISISEPIQEWYEDESLTDEQVKGFKDNIRLKFWDIEEDFGNYKIISDDVAKELQDFIVKNIDNRFIIHCRAGQSRSAGVGKAVECIKFFGVGDEAKYNYQTSFSSEISAHSRYSPNLTVFDKVIQDYTKGEI